MIIIYIHNLSYPFLFVNTFLKIFLKIFKPKIVLVGVDAHMDPKPATTKRADVGIRPYSHLFGAPAHYPSAAVTRIGTLSR